MKRKTLTLMGIMRTTAKKINYARSNKIDSVKFPISAEAKLLLKQIMKSSEQTERQKLSDELLDELADLAKIDIVELKIDNTRQEHKRRNGRIVFKKYGYYKPGGKYIYIHNKTAARGQILAPKTFLDTLLHEWMHHYDFCKLKLVSIHSAGFYKRLKDLKMKLGWE